MDIDQAFMRRISEMQYPGDLEAMDQGQAQGLEQAAMQATVGTLPQPQAQDGQGSMREIPRNAFEQLLGKIGEELTAAGVQLDKIGVELPVVGRVSLKDVTVGDVGNVLENMSYGFMPTRGAGGIGGTAGLKPEALELANLPVVTGAASLAGKGAVKAGKAAAKFAAPKVGEMLDQYMRRSGMTMDLMAYHGSPARFEKFDASKIGTGEGAQKYGYGLYFSSSPDVAGKYRLKTGDGGGAFYTVDIPDEIVKNMLDWDSPIKNQSEVIQRLGKQEGLDPDDFGGDLAFRLGVRSPEAVKSLRDQGVLGVKYFDQASRRKDKANQNFVVFPGGEDQIKILKVE